MHVVATAGHVDHGKSTLVRALTGADPDRWAEEHRRGLTIDLGYAWTRLDSGATVAFVDVPGHRRFIGNMLAGLGPAPAVVFVVAADEGWREQSVEHLAAVDALELRHGLLVVTRADLADPGPATAQAREHIARSTLGDVPAVATSAVRGQGISQVRAALDRLVASLPPADPHRRVRLWVDRAFTVAGSGTVATGTLAAGTIRTGDELEVRGRRVRVRGLQSLGSPVDEVVPVARVALNLRGVDADDIARGDTLRDVAAWSVSTEVDVRLRPRPAPGGPSDPDTASPGRARGTGPAPWPAGLPTWLTLHVGTWSGTVRVRPLGGDVARLVLPAGLPLEIGDRALLRDPGAHRIVAGVVVLDADPPALRRRGAAWRRARDLAGATGRVELRGEVQRRGALGVRDAARLGIDVEAALPVPGVRRSGGWLVAQETWTAWANAVRQATEERATRAPLDPGLSLEAARGLAAIPDLALLREVVAGTDLEVRRGRVFLPGSVPNLGPLEDAVRAIESHLREEPFDAPESHDLDRAGLGRAEIAAAAATGRLLRLRDGVVLLPTAPAMAMRRLAGLPQPFTTSQARQALGTSRRVAIPLLEHLDERGWTRRIDAGHREVVR